MKWLWKVSTLSLLCMGLLACDSGGGASAIMSVRVVNASPDGPVMRFLIGDITILANFRQASSFSSGFAGKTTLTIESEVQGDIMTLLSSQNITLDANTINTIIALGDVGNLDTIIVETLADEPVPNMIRITFAHASQATPEVDVYVTDPGADLATATPVGTLSFAQQLQPMLIDSQNYQIRFVSTATGMVIYDSDPIAPGASQDVLFVAIDNINAQSVQGNVSPARLILADGFGSAFQVVDKDTSGSLRIMHAAPMTGPIDMFLNNDFAMPFAGGLAFEDISAYMPFDAGDTTFTTTPAGDPTTTLLETDEPVLQGFQLTYYVDQSINNGNGRIYGVDDSRTVATEARFRVILAAGAGSMNQYDIYVVDVGQPIFGLDPTISNINFGVDSSTIVNPLALLDGDHDVVFTLIGSNAEVVRQTASFPAGNVYTWVVTDLQQDLIEFTEIIDP